MRSCVPSRAIAACFAPTETCLARPFRRRERRDKAGAAARPKVPDKGISRAYRESVLRMNRLTLMRRSAAAALLAFVLTVRLLSPAGFMPAFDRGSVMIVACPDGEPISTPMEHHHHHGDQKLQQHCPYAAGAAPATTSDFAVIIAALFASAALLSFRSFGALVRRRLRDRPPLRGPPLPA